MIIRTKENRFIDTSEIILLQVEGPISIWNSQHIDGIKYCLIFQLRSENMGFLKYLYDSQEDANNALSEIILLHNFSNRLENIIKLDCSHQE